MLSDQVAKALKNDIIRGVFEPNQKLLLAELKDRYQTGTSPVREAMFRLEACGFLRLENQKGFSVSPISASDCEDLYSTRILLEKEALSQSLKYGDDDWEGRVVSSYHKLAKIETAKTFSSKRWEERHNNYHQSLTGAAKSIHLIHMVDNFRDLTERYRVIWLRSSKKERSFAQSVGEHHDLHEAALARDIRKVQRIITDHFANVVDRIKQVLN